MKEEKSKMEHITVKDISHPEEWETSRNLYSQLCLLGTMQYLLLLRLEKRFADHRLTMAREQKHAMNNALRCINDAAKWLEMEDYISSGLGRGGEKDFVKMNTLLASEGYEALRMMLMWQNATRKGANKVEDIEDYMNKLSTGKKRWFSKKLIDTFKLNA